jgi:hypothetical protein
MGYVTMFMQDYEDAESWPYLDKLICMWREAEEKVRAECGLPPVEPYGRCRLFRDQEPTPVWLQEAGLMPVAAPSTQPTTSPPTQLTMAPINPPTPQPIPQPAPSTLSSPTSSPAFTVTEDPLQEAPPILVLTDELGIAISVPPPAPLVEPSSPSPVQTLPPIEVPTVPASIPIPPVAQEPAQPSPPTDPSGVVVAEELAPEPIDCDAYESYISGGYGRMCHSSDPCCGPQRSDTSYCQNVYDNIFPDSSIYSACYYCCPGGSLKVGDPNPPNPAIPKTIQCSDYNSQRYCKDGGCCQTTRSTQGACISEYLLYGDDVFNQLCVSQST